MLCVSITLDVLLQEILAFTAVEGDGKVVLEPGRESGRNLERNLFARGQRLRRAGRERDRGRRGLSTLHSPRDPGRGRSITVFGTDAGSGECECQQEHNQSRQQPDLHRPSMHPGVFLLFDVPLKSPLMVRHIYPWQTPWHRPRPHPGGAS